MPFTNELLLAFWVFLTGFHMTFGAKDCPLQYRAIVNHSACVSPSKDYISGGVTQEDIKEILYLHNKYRNEVIPPACDMRKMYWDDDLAYVAQQRANTCPIGHEKGVRRLIPGKFTAGQNMALYGRRWTAIIYVWFRESKYFKYNQTTNYFKTGHYTQLAWASTYAVGCGLSVCVDFSISVCNYAPSGNYMGTIKTPYKNCTKRALYLLSLRLQGNPPGFISDKSLVTTGMINPNCKGKICKNGAMMVKGTCNCICPKELLTYGPECNVNCSVADNADKCNNLDASKCFTSSYTYFSCPWKCKTCPYVDKLYKGNAASLNRLTLIMLQMLFGLMSIVL